MRSLVVITLSIIIALTACTNRKSEYRVCAYVWPSCHDDTQPRMVMVNAWNEWVEGSYLLPDEVWGYVWLEAVKHVFKER